mmetsp:Transcript_25935/g.22876  ORF Transcript_25935/g.22876 Transcript_25935/m.22876 type:complete len:190 (+) Transcript_25935:673-1242(+)
MNSDLLKNQDSNETSPALKNTQENGKAMVTETQKFSIINLNTRKTSKASISPKQGLESTLAKRTFSSLETDVKDCESSSSIKSMETSESSLEGTPTKKGKKKLNKKPADQAFYAKNKASAKLYLPKKKASEILNQSETLGLDSADLKEALKAQAEEEAKNVQFMRDGVCVLPKYEKRDYEGYVMPLHVV